MRNLQQATEYVLSVGIFGKTVVGEHPRKKKKMSSTFEKSLININFTPEENVRLVTSVITLIGYQIPSHSFRDAAKQPDSGGQSADLDRFLEQLLVRTWLFICNLFHFLQSKYRSLRQILRFDWVTENRSYFPKKNLYQSESSHYFRICIRKIFIMLRKS